MIPGHNRNMSQTTIGSSRMLLVGLAVLSSACGSSTQLVMSIHVAEAPAPHLQRDAEIDAEMVVPTYVAHAVKPMISAGESLGAVLAFADRNSPVLTVARSTRSRAEAAKVAASIL